MALTYRLTYHPDVISDDIPKLDLPMARRIKAALEQKLQTHPEVFGKPLRHSLKGCRTLRVGEYRAVFVVEKKAIIYIIAILHRSDVYDFLRKNPRLSI